MLEIILGNRVKWDEMNWNETLERQMFATSSSMRAEDLTAWNLLPARWTMGKSLLICLHSNTFQTLQRQPDLKSSRKLKHPRLLWELIRAPIRFLSLDPFGPSAGWRVLEAHICIVGSSLRSNLPATTASHVLCDSCVLVDGVFCFFRVKARVHQIHATEAASANVSLQVTATSRE